MTRKEIEEAKKKLPRMLDVRYSDWTHEQKVLSEELDCRSMINSCLCYGGIHTFWEVCPWRYAEKSYAEPFVKKLGIKRVKELVSEQETDFAKATVKHNVFTDGEGVSYNTIVWADETEEST